MLPQSLEAIPRTANHRARVRPTTDPLLALGHFSSMAIFTVKLYQGQIHVFRLPKSQPGWDEQLGSCLMTLSFQLIFALLFISEVVTAKCSLCNLYLALQGSY